MNINKKTTEDYLNSETIIQDRIDDIILSLIKERKKRKITQNQLSKLTSIPQVTISRLESFSTTPTLQIILKISHALGMSLKIVPEDKYD